MPGSKARTKERRPPGPLQVAVLLTENQIVSELRAALVRRELPERYSYWFPISVRAWLDLCSDGAYRNYLRSRGLVDAHAPELAQAALREAGGGLEVISLGAGQADKDMSVVRALRAAGAVPSYRPVDASQMLLELACAAAADAGVVCEAVKADLSVPAHVAAIDGMRDGRPALWLLLGNTLGAFDPGRLCAELRRVVRRRDSLLLDAEIFDG
ncbi:MAG TPA: L-histidine N(alpha)-methyltransferase [Vicinamibacteria bacterium]|nr:L-histidine N(alpha)-methyltransferase [Vicinamibacteria bacterium]